MRNKTQRKIELALFIEHEKEGTYLTLPFSMPAGTESMHLIYKYERYDRSEIRYENGSFASREEINIIDLGLIAPDGTQVGVSGSNKDEIDISENHATPGYKPCILVPGEWRILVGAYKVSQEGVAVSYEITFSQKHRRLFKGDLHTHTLASDGIFTAEELAVRAQRHGLDFIAITDHNQNVSADILPQVPGFTLIPGLEWTHYQGHANFLGVAKPYDDTFAANSFTEVYDRFKSARERGALIIINHPFAEGNEFEFDLNALPFDCLEIWNGPIRESNLKAIGLWQSMLEAGRKIPICGGSDYHRDTPFVFLGGPTTCVLALSSSAPDILAALKQGHAYISFAPDGPSLEMTAGDAILGDTVDWSQVKELQINADHLLTGDIIRMVTSEGNVSILEAPSAGKSHLLYVMESPGFARIEIYRSLIPGLPMLPVLISNPIYFRDA